MQHLYATKTMLGEVKKIFPNRNRNFQEYLVETECETYNSTTRRKEKVKKHHIIDNHTYNEICYSYLDPEEEKIYKDRYEVYLSLPYCDLFDRLEVDVKNHLIGNSTRDKVLDIWGCLGHYNSNKTLKDFNKDFNGGL
jgi:hypothetical protein